MFKKYIENLQSRAYTLWRVLRAIRWNFVPLGKKYPEHMPFGKCSGQLQEVSRVYTFWRVLRAMARSILSIRLFASAQGNGMKYPEHVHFGECSGQSNGSFCLHARSIPRIRLLASALGPRAHICSSSLCAWKQNVKRLILFGEIPIFSATDTVSFVC